MKTCACDLRNTPTGLTRINYTTLKYTIKPVYKRALLEEANAKLESERANLVVGNDRLRTEFTAATATLRRREEEVRGLQADNKNLQVEQANSSGRLKTVNIDLNAKKLVVQRVRADLELVERKLLAAYAVTVYEKMSGLPKCTNHLLLESASTTDSKALEADLAEGCFRRWISAALDSHSGGNTGFRLRMLAAASTIDKKYAEQYRDVIKQRDVNVSFALENRAYRDYVVYLAGTSDAGRMFDAIKKLAIVTVTQINGQRLMIGA